MTTPGTVAKMAEALRAEIKCQTCEGAGKWSAECTACLYGEGSCTCDNQPEVDCPECEGSGVSSKSGLAAKALAAYEAEQRPDESRSWPEDAGFENGKYICGCIECGRLFYGYKCRVICRKCAEPDDPQPQHNEDDWRTDR